MEGLETVCQIWIFTGISILKAIKNNAFHAARQQCWQFVDKKNLPPENPVSSAIGKSQQMLTTFMKFAHSAL